MPIDMTEIEELERLLEKATQGPFTALEGDLIDALPSLLAEIKRGRELLTADEVMTEVEEVASEPVKKALRMVYDGNAPRGEGKGEIAQVVLKDLALEPVTLYRRKVPRDEAPIRVRHRARAALEGDNG